MFDRPLSKRAGMVGLVVLLLVLVFEVTLSIRQQSLSWDEDDHLYAGYMSLTQRDFGMNPEHPPLVKALAALPLLPMHLQAPAFTGKGYFKGEAFMNGREFLFRNGGETEVYVSSGDWMPRNFVRRFEVTFPLMD